MLSAASAAVVRTTLPVVRDHAAEITAEFYPSMFAAHPELLNLFNHGNQASGKQQIALAAAVVAYAQHLLDRTPFGPIAERIAQKHVSLGVRPDQYPIVGKHLIGAVATVLGDAVTPEIAAAWDEVYWLFAVSLIAAEARLFQTAGVTPDTLWRPWRVAKRDEEAVDTASFTLLPDDGGPVPTFKPGQYVSRTKQRHTTRSLRLIFGVLAAGVMLAGGRVSIMKIALSWLPPAWLVVVGAISKRLRRQFSTANSPLTLRESATIRAFDDKRPPGGAQLSRNALLLA